MNPLAQMRVDSRAKIIFWTIFLVTALLRAWLAVRLPIFVDEAFYFQESQHLAWAYSDVPGLTAWLIRAGTELFGIDPFGIRSLFWLLGCATPFLVMALGRMIFKPPIAYLAAAVACVMPIGVLQSAMALPDAPLTLSILFAWWMLLRAAQSNAWRDWLGLGFGLMVGCLAHYRMAVPLIAGALCVLAYAPARAWLRNPRFWAALVIGAFGALPILIFNLQHDFVGIRFQAVDRHAWAFHFNGLLQPLEQILVALPVVVVPLILVSGLFGFVWLLRKIDPSIENAFQETKSIWAEEFKSSAMATDRARSLTLLVLLSSSLILLYGALGLFADSIRTRVHWLHPAWMALLPIAVMLAHWLWIRFWPRVLIGILTLVSAAILAFTAASALVLTRDPATIQASTLFNRFYPANFVGWQAAHGLVQRHWQPASQILIADNFKTAAELQVKLANSNDNPKIFVTDDDANAKHGRAAQLAIWQRDQAALNRFNWQRGLLVVEETATKPIDVLPRLHRLCAQFGAMRWLESVDLAESRTRFSVYAVSPKDPVQNSLQAQACVLSIQFDLHPPTIKRNADGAVEMHLLGWAFQDGGGVQAVRARVLDAEQKQLSPWVNLEYGTPFEGVQGQWPMSTDPRHPNVGFKGRIKLPSTGFESAESLEFQLESDSSLRGRFIRKIARP